MNNYFLIDGYYKDDKTEFYGYLVSEFDGVEDEDDEIFYYGLTESDIVEAIESGGEGDILEFVITNYTKL